MYSQKLHEFGYSNKNDSCDSITAPHSIRQPWRMKTLTTTANKKAVLPQRYDNLIKLREIGSKNQDSDCSFNILQAYRQHNARLAFCCCRCCCCCCSSLNLVVFTIIPTRTKWSITPKTTIAFYRVQELCESRGGRPGLSVLMSLTVSVDVKQH